MLENPMVTGATTYRIEAPGAVCRCAKCRAPMYSGEYLYIRDGVRICEECVDEYMREMSSSDFAENMGWERVEVE